MKLHDVAMISKNMKKLLSEQFPGHEFSIFTYARSKYSVISIKWKDGPQKEEIEHLLDPFIDQVRSILLIRLDSKEGLQRVSKINKRFSFVEQDPELEQKIEKVKTELQKLIEERAYNLLDPDIIAKSIELDKLMNRYKIC